MYYLNMILNGKVIKGKAFDNEYIATSELRVASRLAKENGFDIIIYAITYEEQEEING